MCREKLINIYLDSIHAVHVSPSLIFFFSKVESHDLSSTSHTQPLRFHLGAFTPNKIPPFQSVTPVNPIQRTPHLKTHSPSHAPFLPPPPPPPSVTPSTPANPVTYSALLVALYSTCCPGSTTPFIVTLVTTCWCCSCRPRIVILARGFPSR